MAAGRIKVSYGRTCQSAPYESIRLDVSLEEDVLNPADAEKVTNQLTDTLVKYVKTKIANILKNE